MRMVEVGAKMATVATTSCAASEDEKEDEEPDDEQGVRQTAERFETMLSVGSIYENIPLKCSYA